MQQSHGLFAIAKLLVFIVTLLDVFYLVNEDFQKQKYALALLFWTTLYMLAAIYQYVERPIISVHGVI